MAKFATLAAVFGVLLVAATATRTTMLTVDVEEENQRRRWGGGQQYCSADMLSHCQDFLEEMQMSGGGQCGYGGSQFGGGSRFGGGGVRGSRHFQPCCSQLRQMEDQQCMCEGLRDVMRQQMGGFGGGRFGGGGSGGGSQEILECVRQLPQMCRVGRSCYQIRGIDA